MPELPQPDPATLHEQFVAEMKAIDVAYDRGTLHEWIERKLADERSKFGSDGITT